MSASWSAEAPLAAARSSWRRSEPMGLAPTRRPPWFLRLTSSSVRRLGAEYESTMRPDGIGRGKAPYFDNPKPSGPGAEPKQTRRRCQLHAKFLQGLARAVLSDSKRLVEAGAR